MDERVQPGLRYDSGSGDPLMSAAHTKINTFKKPEQRGSDSSPDPSWQAWGGAGGGMALPDEFTQ